MKTPPSTTGQEKPSDLIEEISWILRLYVVGQTSRSKAAIEALKAICEENLPGRYRVEVIDLLTSPQLAEGDQIMATPTVVRRLPLPIKHLIGDLSNTNQVLVGLDIISAA